MSNILITFGGAAFDEHTSKTVERGRDLGADEVLVYDDRWLMGTEFYRVNQWWWHKADALNGNPNRGFGWFIWKPYVILHALGDAEFDDVVLFIDGDTWPIADLTPIFETARRDGLMLFNSIGCHHARWCKRDCFIVMGQDEQQWRDRDHACARFMAFCKGTFTGGVLTSWLQYCLNPGANTMDASVLAPEHPEFYEHRCEQAILTNLAHKYGHRLYREACQAGKDQPQDQELYHQLFEHQWANGDRADLSGSKYRNVE